MKKALILVLTITFVLLTVLYLNHLYMAPESKEEVFSEIDFPPEPGAPKVTVDRQSYTETENQQPALAEDPVANRTEDNRFISKAYRSEPEFQAMSELLEQIYWASQDPLREEEVLNLLMQLQSESSSLFPLLLLDLRNGEIPGLLPSTFSESMHLAFDKIARQQLDEDTREGLYSIYKSDSGSPIQTNIVTFSDFSLNEKVAMLHMDRSEPEQAMAILRNTITRGSPDNLDKLILASANFGQNRESYESMVIDLVASHGETVDPQVFLSVFIDMSLPQQTRDLAMAAIEAHPDRTLTEQMLDKIWNIQKGLSDSKTGNDG
jgi:hypothetical protein